MDKRAGKPVFTLSAHDEAVTGTHLHRKYKVNMLGGTLRYDLQELLQLYCSTGDCNNTCTTCRTCFSNV